MKKLTEISYWTIAETRWILRAGDDMIHSDFFYNKWKIWIMIFLEFCSEIFKQIPSKLINKPVWTRIRCLDFIP